MLVMSIDLTVPTKLLRIKYCVQIEITKKLSMIRLREVYNMKQKLIIVGMALVLLTVVLSGCTSTKTNEERFLGSWITERSMGQDETAAFNFFSNGTFSLVVTVLLNESDVNFTTLTFWEPYTISDETVAMVIEGKTEILEYSFSDDNILTLTEDNGESTVLLRQQ